MPAFRSRTQYTSCACGQTGVFNAQRAKSGRTAQPPINEREASKLFNFLQDTGVMHLRSFASLSLSTSTKRRDLAKPHFTRAGLTLWHRLNGLNSRKHTVCDAPTLVGLVSAEEALVLRQQTNQTYWIRLSADAGKPPADSLRLWPSRHFCSGRCALVSVQRSRDSLRSLTAASPRQLLCSPPGMFQGRLVAEVHHRAPAAQLLPKEVTVA